MPDEGEDGTGLDRAGDGAVDEPTVRPGGAQPRPSGSDNPGGAGRRRRAAAGTGEGEPEGPAPGSVVVGDEADPYDGYDDDLDDDPDDGPALIGSVRDPRVTARLRAPVVIEGEDEEPRSVLLLAAGAVALVLVGVLLGVGLVIGGVISSNGDDDGRTGTGAVAATPPTTEPGEVTTTVTVSTTDPPATDRPTTTDGADPVGTDEDREGDGSPVTAPTVMTAAPPVATPTPDNPRGALAYMVLEDGVLHFRGVYPSQELLDGLVADAATANGPDGVADEGEIDPAVTFDDRSFPLYLEDLILFETKSAELSEEFETVLTDTVSYLADDPDATITVVARTDYLGDAAENLELSRQRAQAVVDFWIGRGVDPARLAIDPRGEQEANQNPATAEEAALDRRVELVISGLG